jgi:hypothetical protein
MSPQFVDFDADGKLDIVAGIFDGSPHVALGTDKGWQQPQQILEAGGERIVLNQFWNFDTKKWDETTRSDLPGAQRGHLTSAVAFDWDGDGDLDLLLGDHTSGRIYRRMNEGTPAKPAFAAKNIPLSAGGAELDVPGTVSTLRLVDWNKDGLLDILASGMGKAYEGGSAGVSVFLNTGSKTSPTFGPRRTLIEPGDHKGLDALARPDAGLYVDVADFDGDGDLDLVVGGYSHWATKAPVLTREQQARVEVLQRELADCGQKQKELNEGLERATEGLSEEAAEKARETYIAAHKEEFPSQAKRRRALQEELDPLVPGAKRDSFVWLYENLAVAPAPAGR